MLNLKIDLSVYSLVFRAKELNSKFSLKEGDLIVARKECHNDMEKKVVEVIQVNHPIEKKGYVVKVLENMDTRLLPRFSSGTIWNMRHMKNSIHTDCDIYRKTKIKSWREKIR